VGYTQKQVGWKSILATNDNLATSDPKVAAQIAQVDKLFAKQTAWAHEQKVPHEPLSFCLSSMYLFMVVFKRESRLQLVVFGLVTDPLRLSIVTAVDGLHQRPVRALGRHHPRRNPRRTRPRSDHAGGEKEENE